MAMALHKISRLSSEVDQLGSIYVQTCRDIDSFKVTKRQIKNQLKETRDDLESFTSRAPGMSTHRADVRLAKADKKTAIRELERRLSQLRTTLQELNKARDRAFSKREETKVKMMKKMVGVMTSNRPVEIVGAEDVAVVAKVMEWLRVCPASEVGRLAREESIIHEIRDACQRFNVVGVDFGDRRAHNQIGPH